MAYGVCRLLFGSLRLTHEHGALGVPLEAMRGHGMLLSCVTRVYQAASPVTCMVPRSLANATCPTIEMSGQVAGECPKVSECATKW